MNRTALLIFIFTCLLTLLADVAWGQDDLEEDAISKQQLRSLFAKFDANQDGKVSLTEIMTFARSMGRSIANKDIGAIVEEVDTNRDGQLSLDEHLSDIINQADGGDEEELKMLEIRKRVETQKFRAADADGDGVLSLSEIASLFYPETYEPVLDVSVQETMRQKDQDGDGALDPKEFWEFHPEDGDDQQLSEEEISDFQRLDRNSDGVLDIVELKQWESGVFHTEAAMIRILEIADKDGDMHASLAEFEDARQEIASSDGQYHLIEWAEHLEL